MEDLSSEIKKAIDNNLPKQVGEQLQLRLAMVAELERSLESHKKSLAASEAKCSRLSDDLAKVKSIDEREAAVAKREAAVIDCEHRIEMAKLNADYQREKSDAIYRLVDVVFSNKRLVHETWTENANRSYPTRSGDYLSSAVETKTTHKETEIQD